MSGSQQRVILAVSGDIFPLQSGWDRGATHIQWVEDRGAMKHTTMHRTDPIAKNYLTQNHNTTAVEMLCYR